MMRLKTERDAYKSQVDDLQAIREAYAQLVEKQPNVSHVERKLWQEVDLKEQKLKGITYLAEAKSCAKCNFPHTWHFLVRLI